MLTSLALQLFVLDPLLRRPVIQDFEAFHADAINVHVLMPGGAKAEGVGQPIAKREPLWFHSWEGGGVMR